MRLCVCVCVRVITQPVPGFVIRVSTAPEVSRRDQRDQPDEQSPARRLSSGERRDEGDGEERRENVRGEKTKDTAARK